MGHTNQKASTGAPCILRALPNDKVIALAGNPNVGKSTVFNALTGLNQHTGNWPGKTVANAQGKYKHKDKEFLMIDIPGTYSLMATSPEEEVARDFICFGQPDATIVVTDATCLERNLNLVLQTLEITNKVVVCVNLVDEAERRRIRIDFKALSIRLGVPVIPTNARSKKGLKELMDAVYDIACGKMVPNPIKLTYGHEIESAIALLAPRICQLTEGKINPRWVALKLFDQDFALLGLINAQVGFPLTDDPELCRLMEKAREKLYENGIDKNDLWVKIVSRLVIFAEGICCGTVTFENAQYNSMDRKIDSVLTSRIFGIPIMIGLLGVVFWLTIIGANYPSKMLANFLFWIENNLTLFFTWAGTPPWVHGALVLGIYRTLAWVVSVMLPPMAIFFPLFTLLEDVGYLPRVAFNLDNFFKKSCTNGKQSLTMCMGLGCNAAGVTSCRIIDSKRERLIAIITNAFVPCNGRFPTLIAVITMFFAGFVAAPLQSVISTLLLTGVIVLGVLMTFIISRILSNTILKGLASSFTLELPPYRKPQIGKVIVRSVFDRTIFVLGRAVAVAAPAGLVIWMLANITVSDQSLLTYCANFLGPFATLLGLDGYILLAFILGLPANEIVLPIIIMSYMATGQLSEIESIDELRQLLISHGWTWLTAVCVMLFSLMHWPCAATLCTIKKETQSLKWTVVSFVVPSLVGMIICFIIASAVRLLGLL